MDRIKKRLNIEDSALSVNKDFKVNIPLTNTSRLFLPNDINHVVNQFEQFEIERNECTTFRLIGTIKTLFSNPLFNVNDDGDVWGGLNDNNWGTFDETRFKSEVFSGGKILTYKEAYSKHLDEKNGWFGYTPPFTLTGGVSTCIFEEMLPTKETFKLNSPTHQNNWGFKITYPASTTTNHNLVDGGLLLISQENVTIGGREMSVFKSIIKHGLSVGDFVRISGLSPTPSTTTYRVRLLGEKNGVNEDYSFIVDTSREPILNMTNGRMKKVIGYGGVTERESEYYVRIFKTITESNDYELYPLVLAQNIYEDQTNQIVFNGGTGADIDLDIKDLKDNLGRPLSQLYLTVVKKNNLGFTDISSGFDFPYCEALDDGLTDVSDINRIHNVPGWATPTQTPTEIDVTIDQEMYYGDIVEYNELSQREMILSDASHTFTTDNRVLNGRPEGYTYKPHHLYEIRKFSNYIEQGYVDTTYNIPSYATDLGDGRFVWRDYLWLGYGEDKLDYPFTNGSHYIHKNLLMTLRRQDPMNNYGLYYTSDNTDVDPRDPFGDIVDDNNFIIHQTNVC